MRTVTKEFKWDMAHRLPDYQGKCWNVHGHTYKVLITLEGKSVQAGGSNDGMLRDFSLLNPIKEWIDENRDHSYVGVYGDKITAYLKEEGFKVYVMDVAPTAENMAKILFDKFKNEFPLKSITIYETPTSFTTYDGENE